LILRKVIKIVATRCRILKLKCTKFDFGWGFAPDLAGGAYSTPQTPWRDLRGATSKRRGGKTREGQGRRSKVGRGPTSKASGEGTGGREGKGRVSPSNLEPNFTHGHMGEVCMLTDVPSLLVKPSTSQWNVYRSSHYRL